MCPWNQNIPQAGDKLRNSQLDLLNNNLAINAGFDFNHVNLNLAGAGKHKLLTMPRQAFPQPAINNLGNDLLMYVGLEPRTGLSQLYLKRNTDMANEGIPTTAKLVPTGQVKGWTYLPSGVLIQWGEAQCLANAFVTIDLVAVGGISYPAGTGIGNYVVTVTPKSSGTNVFTVQTQKNSEQSFTITPQNISGGLGNTLQFTWMTIGA